ncbi:MAG TPA: GntR family transcriptional regulator [Clostridiales bacterium]|nr:GntR family transcriptional regulator [Clostridiales bacterium]
MSEVLYLTIVKSLKNRIHKGEYRPGDMLDSEAVLMKEYNASRMTIRKSLSLLSSEGYIYSVPGKGNFVCTPETNLFQFRFNKYDDLGAPIEEVKLISVQVKKGELDTILRLKQGARDKTVEAKRLLCCVNGPMALEYIYFTYIPNMPVVEERLKFANHLASVEKKLAFSIEKKMTLNIDRAGEEQAKWLQCKTGTPLVLLEEDVINSEDGSVVSFTRFYALPAYINFAATTAKEEANNKKIF